MKLERKPNQWSCLATSFAMALDITTARFEELASHDGSAIVFPALPEPQCRRGYHVCEAVRVVMMLGHAATPVELMPQIGSKSGDSIRCYYDARDEDFNWTYFHALILYTRGVIECMTRSGNFHAVAYEKGRIFDPDGREFDYSREACESRGLYTTRLWRIEKVQ